MHDRLWIADEGYLEKSIRKVLSVAKKGEFGILMRLPYSAVLEERR